MSITFAGGTALSSERDVVHFGPLRFWAERGLVHCEDSRDNSYECFSVRVALQRMSAISDMLGNSSARQMYSEDQFDQMNRKRHLTYLAAMTQIVQKAQQQGMPDDPSARKDLVRRRTRTVVVPGLKDQM